jgi:hypothetical protein
VITMPKFDIQTLERWDILVGYTVDADTAEVAVRKIITGCAANVSAQRQDISPDQEVLRIIDIKNHDTKEIINDETRLTNLMGSSFN